ncbi:MAG: MraY family glycosyltransferase, partial [bacterium]|nr:MraY family glycosyltransferase [bacterium]
TPSSPISALVAIILLGAMLAFLTFNYNPAKIFMGDSGALFAGFMLSTLSITGIMSTGTPMMYLPFLILAIPILDVAYSSIRRISKGKSPFVADSEHIHHKLLHHGFSQDLAVLTLSSVSMVCAIVAIITTGFLNKYFIFAIALVFVLFLLNAVSKTIKKNP